MATTAMSLGEQWRIYRLEGMTALQNRSQDRNEEAKRLKKLDTLGERDGRLEIAVDNPLVLNVAVVPPAWERTGAQQQFVDRLNEERNRRTVALAYPRDDAWWLEIWSANTAGIYALGEAINPVEAILQAARLTRVRIIHVESLTGLPPHLVQSLDERDYEVVLSLHDFTPFCARPNLIEQRTKRFCDYCTDLARCAACLKEVDLGVARTQENYRKVGAETLRQARLLVYPSAFMQRRFSEFYPRRQAGQHEVVVAPATARPEVEPWPRDRLNIAFVGGVHQQTGGALIAPTVSVLHKRNPKVACFVYGTGDQGLLRELHKTKGCRVKGYYRPGTLATLLARDKIAVAVWPSIWPDPYGVEVDECLAAGVPVVVFEIGAVADRLNFWEVGRVVRPHHGPPGLATAVFDTIGRSLSVPADVIKTIPSAARVGRRMTELYRSLRVRIR
jgi:glycosyltransferase involved in cell wall biosynthesis